MRWLPGIREEDDDNNKSHSKQQLSGRKLYEAAKKELDKEESSRALLATVSRIHPKHDRKHRNRFSYHGDTHQQQTDGFGSASG